MADVRFESEDEDVQKLAGLVVELQQAVMQLKQRSEIDMLMLATLLRDAEDHGALLKAWKNIVADYYPSQAVSNLSHPLLEKSTSELNRRTAFWTGLLEQCVQRNDR